MIRYFYKMDEHFKKAYEQSEETPTTSTWEEISGKLDEADAVLYKKKFKQWKTVALLLFCLLGSYGVFETARLIHKTPAGHLAVHRTTVPNAIVPGKKSWLAVTPTIGASYPSINAKIVENSESNLLAAAFPVEDLRQRETRSKRRLDHPGAIYARVNSSLVTLTINPFWMLKDNEQAIAHGSPLQVVHTGMSTASKAATLALSKPHQSKKWTLLASASLDHADYRIDDDLPVNDSKASIEGRETHNVSFSVSVTARYALSNRWSLQSGLRYSNTLIGIDPHEIYAEQTGAGPTSYKYVTSSGYAYISPGFNTHADSLQTTSARHHLIFVSVPLLVNYRIGKDKWILRPSLGLQMNWLAKASVKTEIQQGSETEAVSIHQLEGRKSFYMSYVAETEIEYQWSPQWAINLTPSFQYGITSITKNNEVNTFPYSFGLGIGMMYHF